MDGLNRRKTSTETQAAKYVYVYGLPHMSVSSIFAVQCEIRYARAVLALEEKRSQGALTESSCSVSEV